MGLPFRIEKTDSGIKTYRSNGKERVTSAEFGKYARLTVFKEIKRDVSFDFIEKSTNSNHPIANCFGKVLFY